MIAYEEKEAGTMIKTDGHKDLPAQGRFWIEPATGRVLMSELRRAEPQAAGDDRRQLPVGAAARPAGADRDAGVVRQYAARRSHIEAVATYGKFRQFQVNTDQTFLIKQ